MSCPLTLAYLTEIGKMLEGYDKMRVIFGTVIDHINNLKERAEVVPGTKEYQRLRGFYCIELMSSTLIRRALDGDKLLTRYAGQSIPLEPYIRKMFEPTPRSWEGLGAVIDKLEGLDGELSIRVTEMAFAQRSQFGEREEVMLKERFKTTMKSFEIGVEASKLLRRSLGNSELPIHLVGKALASSVDVLQLPHQERINYGLNLLNISPDNPVSVWPTKTESQE